MFRRGGQSNKKIKIIISCLILLLAAGGWWFLAYRQTGGKLRKITIGQQTLWVEVATTPAAQTKGLSGRLDLPDNQGMLFVFKAKGQPIFWMKEMHFPLDFIWLVDQRVVEIAENIEPPPAGLKDADLALYRPGVMVDEVLEVKAGWVKQHGVKIGDKLTKLNIY